MFSFSNTKLVMSFFPLLVLCVQAFLIQNAFGQYLSPARYDVLLPGAIASLGTACGAPTNVGLGAEVAPGIVGYPAAYGLGAEIIAPGITTFPAAYGVAGVGDVAVAGEMPVAGTTLVTGQVPVIGFAGELPAAGIVSVVGNCGCGCAAPSL